MYSFNVGDIVCGIKSRPECPELGKIVEVQPLDGIVRCVGRNPPHSYYIREVAIRPANKMEIALFNYKAWMMKTGKIIHIEEMSFSHLVNTIKMLEGKRNPYTRTMTNEINRRLFNKILKETE